MALLLVQLGPQTTQVLRIVGLLVSLTGLALALTLIVVKALTVLLLPALDVPEEKKLIFERLGVAGGDGRTRSEAVEKIQVSEIPGV